MNFANWFAMPRNLLNSGIPVVACISTMAEFFSGSARIPVASMMCPRNLSDDRATSHLLRLSVTPAALILIPALLPVVGHNIMFLQRRSI